MSNHARIDALTEAGVLADIDRYFARLTMDLGAADDVALAAATTSALHRNGHACLDLGNAGKPIAALVERPDSGRPEDTLASELQAVALPGKAALLEALARSPVVAADGGAANNRPLVLDGERLYLHRLFHAERELAARLRVLAADRNRPNQAESTIARVFDEVEDRTAEAIAALRITLERRLCIVTGGPGTGKTTLAAKLIAALVDAGLAHPRRIGLAAPTGKAASRIQESVRGKLRPSLLDRIPGLREFAAEAWTVHRLLASRTSRMDRLDALVVDECSMADLQLMVRLATALPEGCRLILLGDADQLASVEPGSVFSDLCRAGDAGALAHCVTTLTKNYRFETQSDIGRLARAVVGGNADRALAVLRGGGDARTRLHPLEGEAAFDAFARESAGKWTAHMTKLQKNPMGADPFPAERVLCSHRRGPFGTDRFNRLVERRLAEAGHRTGHDEFYVGRPIIVSRNDRQTNLSNGDTGVVVPGDSGHPRVWFPDLDRDGERYLVSPARLPQHESFFALTVHRAQGSEYDDLVFIPGDAASRVNTRELFYTAVTRARETVTVMAGRDAVRAAVMRTTSRATGLLDRLR
ncbi:MAG: exodeoxyribonuclease V subunit alpha [Holophagales bacterium]|nr:exodeoxyribonuclease V subunit alpha [Holophagales bacterium]MYJ25650.1 exodeoxyribonuclease V subunit alpha [Holophagales bacterium]